MISDIRRTVSMLEKTNPPKRALGLAMPYMRELSACSSRHLYLASPARVSLAA
jgi:hypothetical protein